MLCGPTEPWCNWMCQWQGQANTGSTLLQGCPQTCNDVELSLVKDFIWCRIVPLLNTIYIKIKVSGNLHEGWFHCKTGCCQNVVFTDAGFNAFQQFTKKYPTPEKPLLHDSPKIYKKKNKKNAVLYTNLQWQIQLYSDFKTVSAEHNCTVLNQTDQLWSKFYTTAGNCTVIQLSVQGWRQPYSERRNCTVMNTNILQFKQHYSVEYKCTLISSTVYWWTLTWQTTLYSFETNCTLINTTVPW